MSFNTYWDIDKYREDHESEEHWQLRCQFMQKWKTDYPEERLVCLARVFANIELLGCRYPLEVMQEVAQLSREVSDAYRKSRKNKLQRTFVSASAAAEDRAKGVKREGGIVVETPPSKSSKITFVRPGENTNTATIQISDSDSDNESKECTNSDVKVEEKRSSEFTYSNDYLNELLQVKCLDYRTFSEDMFETSFGRLVMLVRPWTSKLSNIQSSCQSCHIQITNTFEKNCYSLLMNGRLVAQATGSSKAEAKSIVEIMAWNRLREEAISVLVKEQWIAQGDARISVSEVAGGGRREEFGTPIENSVATKMMQLMGWKGGGLGADAQGIAEPIKPHLQMVNRAGLGSQATDIKQLRRAAQSLMQRYIASDTLDLDLVFSSDFSKEERAQLHQVAQRAGLASRSYGDKDRFLVVKKKLNPFTLVHAILDKGGNTPKYQVFIPAGLRRNGKQSNQGPNAHMRW